MKALARIAIFLSLIAFLSTIPTSAEYRKRAMGGSYGVGFSFPMGQLADDRLYDAKFGGMLSFDVTVYFSDSFGFGIGVSIERFKTGSASEIYLEGISKLDVIDWELLSFTYFFSPKKRFQPYLELSAGGSQMRFKTGDDKLKSGVSFAAGTSAGALYFVTSQDIGLFGEVSYKYGHARYGDLGSQRHSTPRLRVKLGTVVFFPQGP